MYYCILEIKLYSHYVIVNTHMIKQYIVVFNKDTITRT